MTGTFIRKKTGAIVCLICGLLLLGLFVFLSVADPETTDYSGVLLGGLITIFSIFFLSLNYKAHFTIVNDRICSKYHWFGKLDCDISEVAFASAAFNTLSILLKNGKRHVIMGIEDPLPLASAIRRQIFSVETESPAKLQRDLASTQAARKGDLYRIFGGIALMFVYIFVAVLLTGGREMYDFSTLDWTIFTIMCAFEILNVIFMFHFAVRSGKYLLPIDWLKYRLRGAVIATQPLPAGNVRSVYSDENYFGRVVVCGFPNDEGVYYCVQKLTGNYNLKTVHTSEIFTDYNQLPAEDFLSLIDITPQYAQKIS